MKKTVQCSGQGSASADDVWRVVSDFDVAWHPMVAWCKVKVDEHAQTIRSFGGADDAAVMTERLTYLSHSDRVMSYAMVEGIEGAFSYEARFRVAPTEAGSKLTWQAEIGAEPARVAQITEGTKAVFDAGIEALKSVPSDLPQRGVDLSQKSAISDMQIGDTPRLGLSVVSDSAAKMDTMCLYLHGIGGNRSNWDAQLQALGHLCPMVAMDLRGYGDSTLGLSQTQVDDYCADILAVMDRFGARRLVLVGLSYGAWIAASFALRHADKMAGLVLCGGCTGMSEADPAEREAFRVSREVPLDAGQTPADFAPSVVDIIAGPRASATTREALRCSMAAIPKDTYRDALNCFCNPPSHLDFDRSTFPVLLMTGEHDVLAPPAEIRAVSHRFADAGAPFVGFEEIGDAGHVCNLENPDLVNQHLGAFLRTVVQDKSVSPKVAKRAEKRARIMAAALAEFSKNGYSGASMQAIAARADVSKPTLYQYVGQKEDIFRAVLEEGRATILAPFDQADGQELVSVLWAFSWVYADYVLHPDSLSLSRLVIGEAERVPEIAKQFYDTGPARVLAGIAAFLQSQKEAGALSFEDAHLAAEDLWSLILSGPRNHALHFPQEVPDQETVKRSVVNGLSVFLRAYSVSVDADLAALQKLSS